MNIYKLLPKLDNTRQLNLYHKALRSQWSAPDLDWSLPLGVRASRLKDQLGRIMTPVLMGEQSALYSIATMIPSMGKRGEVEGQFYLTSWALDEARHTEVFSHFCRRLDREPMSLRKYPSGYLFQSSIYSKDPAEWLTGLLVVEVLAKKVMEEFKRLDIDPVLSDISDRILDDEARHLAFDHIYLEDRFEKQFREDPVEAQAYAEQLKGRLTNTQSFVAPMFDALDTETREIGMNRDEMLDAVIQETDERFARCVRRGERRATGELEVQSQLEFSPVLA